MSSPFDRVPDKNMRSSAMSQFRRCWESCRVHGADLRTRQPNESCNLSVDRDSCESRSTHSVRLELLACTDYVSTRPR